MGNKHSTSPEFTLPETIQMGPVRLRVQNAEHCLKFYRDLLGMQTQKIDADTFFLWAPGTTVPLIILHQDASAAPPPPRCTGLYHLAIRLPERRDLGAVLIALMDNDYPLQGFADHGVSEALYLSDPEGNGVEIYWDRPKQYWPYRHGELAMITRPLATTELLEEARGFRWNGLPVGTTLGHVHLKVSDLSLAEKFYHHGVGFQVTQRSYPGALFFAAGDYHHHLGCNIWHSRGAGSAPPGSTGLISFALQLPEEALRQKIVQRLSSLFQSPFQEQTMPFGHSLLTRDLDGIGLELILASS